MTRNWKEFKVETEDRQLNELEIENKSDSKSLVDINEIVAMFDSSDDDTTTTLLLSNGDRFTVLSKFEDVAKMVKECARMERENNKKTFFT